MAEGHGIFIAISHNGQIIWEETFMSFNLSSFLQWKINIFLYQKLGWNLALVYIIVLGNLYFLFKPDEKRKIKEAIKTAFCNHKKPFEIERIIKKVFQGTLNHYHEKIFNVYSPIDRLKNFFSRHITPEGISVIEEEIARGKGVLLVTGHFGGIEFIPTFLAVQNYPVTIMAKFSSDHLRKISKELAGKLKFRIIDAHDCPNIIKTINANLKDNRIVITQCDEVEEWRPSLEEKVCFLGKQTFLDKTINTIIRRTKTTVIFAVMLRLDKQSYKFVAHSWDEILDVGLRLSSASIGETVLKLLEHYIYNYPEEWYQWKKVIEIKTLEGKRDTKEERRSPALLQPAFGKIS